MKLVAIALRDFALPVPRTGSLDTYSGYGRPSADGQEIHGRVQRKRTKSDATYESEVQLSCMFERAGYRFQINGRIDGLFRQDPPIIEEIKTGFDIDELSRRLSNNPIEHPYHLQLQSYGYFYWLRYRVIPKLTFHLVSSRNGKSMDLERTLDISAYEKWLDARLDELVLETQKAERRAVRRKKIASRIAFPYGSSRPGQAGLIRAIEQGMSEGCRLLMQAPTGLGKTAGVLYPVLKDALRRGQKVIYVTPKNSQHSVAENTVARFQEAGLNLKALSITAKSKICFKSEPLCTTDYCEYAHNYYTKLHANGILDLLAKKKKLKARVFRDLGKEYVVCPFELQFDGARDADIVICDYNYVFAPRTPLGRITAIDVDQEGKPNLVIDEVHNLPERAMGYYSPSLSSSILAMLRDELRKTPCNFHGEIEALLDSCIETIISCWTGDSPNPARIDPPKEQFLDRDAKIRACMSRYLDADVTIEPGDVLLRLGFYWSEFTAVLETLTDRTRQEFFATFHPHPTGGTVKITCCDASAMLKDCYDEYEHVVGFSATLKPFDYYAKLSGLDSKAVKNIEFTSPFLKEYRKLLIIPQISTKYLNRARNYHKIADAIKNIASLRRGNYFAFFPSFEFLERVLGSFQAPEGFAILSQVRDMKIRRVEEILERLHERTIPTIVFAVQGGVFSEGVDYPGDMVIGAFVIGPPLPTCNLEREQMRAYYQRQFGEGFDFAYTIPAMAKAIQAAGRVIRSETDRGLIVLMDNRFVETRYARSMPADWFETHATELVSTSILKEVSDFWRRSFDEKSDGHVLKPQS